MVDFTLEKDRTVTKVYEIEMDFEKYISLLPFYVIV